MRDDPLRGNDELIRLAHTYFARLTAHPVPRTLEPGAPFVTPSQRMSRPRRVVTVLAFVAVGAAFSLVILGVGHLLSTRLGTSTSQSSPATSAPIPAVSPPPGGPVPAALSGDWLQKGNNPSVGPDVIFSGTKYELVTTGGMTFGRVAVNGNEIDFYNGDGCAIPLPGGVGRYEWSLLSGVLHFTPLQTDPCGGRTRPLANQSFVKQSG
jgi:hypothetical protein